MELKNAQKRLSHLQGMMCLGITGGMRSTTTSALEIIVHKTRGQMGGK
jgi:hypothetical protein